MINYHVHCYGKLFMLTINEFVAMVDQIERYVHSQIQCHWVDFVDHNLQSLEVYLCEVEWPLSQDNPSHNMQA